MERFKNFTRLEDKLTGDIQLPEIGKLKVDLDLEDCGTDDVRDVMSQAESWLANFDKNTLEKLITDIATELTDAAYSGTDYQPVKSDYADLERSLKLKAICFYKDAETTLVFESATEYPDMTIYCLLDDEFTIADLFADPKDSA